MKFFLLLIILYVYVYYFESFVECFLIFDKIFVIMVIMQVYFVLDFLINGIYLAVGCYDGYIFIFDFKIKICVDRYDIIV